MHVLCCLAIVASTFKIGDISWPSSRQAEKAGHPVANAVAPTIYFVLCILVGFTFLISALVATKRICVHKSLLQGPSSRLYDLDWVAFSSTCSQLLLLSLHLLFQL